MKLDWFDRRPIAIVLAVTALFYWKLFFSDQFTFLDSPDHVYQILPWYQVQAAQWNAGAFPLWDPYVWAGQTLVGQMQPGAMFPLNWPLFLAPLKDGFINLKFIHWHYAAMHLLAALFMYALLRELGRSRYASIFGGVAFACGGYVGAIGWPQMLHGAVWLPLVFLLFHRVERAQSGAERLPYAILCGGAVGLALLSGHHQTPIFMLLGLTGLFLLFAWRRRASRARLSRWCGWYFTIAGVAFLVAAMQLLPMLEYAERSVRWVGADNPIGIDDKLPYYLMHEFRAYPITWLGAVVPGLHRNVNVFVGFVCLGLAALGTALAWKQRWTPVYAALGLAALSYSAAHLSILHGWAYAFVPFADKARSASHAIYIQQFALLVLAAHGIDRLLAAGPDDADCLRWTVRLQRVLLGCGAVFLAALYFQAAGGAMEAVPGDQFAVAAVSAFLFAALLQGRRRSALGSTALKTALLLLMVHETAAVQIWHIKPRDDRNQIRFLTELQEFQGVYRFLQKQERPFRSELHHDPAMSLSAWYGVEASDGYTASLTNDILAFIDAWPSYDEGRLRLNTKYTIAQEPTRDGQIEVYADPNTAWRVYFNPNHGPRAWLEHAADNIETAAAGAFAPAGCGGGGTIEYALVSAQAARVRATAPCDAYLVVADPYYPGWTATNHGKPTPLLRAYGGVRAVMLPAGENLVEFAYRPGSVYAGAILSGVGFLLCCGAAGALVRRRRLKSRASGATMKE